MVQQGIGNKTLKFVEKDSKNADTTENIYIEGDNLEVLKLLRQNYYNSIKMIYIDMFFSKMIQEPILYSLQSNLNKGFKKNQNRIKQSLFQLIERLDFFILGVSISITRGSIKSFGVCLSISFECKKYLINKVFLRIGSQKIQCEANYQ